MWQQRRNGNDSSNPYKTEDALCLHGRHLDGQQQNGSNGKKRQEFVRRVKKSEGVSVATARTEDGAERAKLCVGTVVAEKRLVAFTAVEVIKMHSPSFSGFS